MPVAVMGRLARSMLWHIDQAHAKLIPVTVLLLICSEMQASLSDATSSNSAGPVVSSTLSSTAYPSPTLAYPSLTLSSNDVSSDIPVPVSSQSAAIDSQNNIAPSSFAMTQSASLGSSYATPASSFSEWSTSSNYASSSSGTESQHTPLPGSSIVEPPFVSTDSTLSMSMSTTSILASSQISHIISTKSSSTLGVGVSTVQPSALASPSTDAGMSPTIPVGTASPTSDLSSVHDGLPSSLVTSDVLTTPMTPSSDLSVHNQSSIGTPSSTPASQIEMSSVQVTSVTATMWLSSTGLQTEASPTVSLEQSSHSSLQMSPSTSANLIMTSLSLESPAASLVSSLSISSAIAPPASSALPTFPIPPTTSAGTSAAATSSDSTDQPTNQSGFTSGQTVAISIAAAIIGIVLIIVAVAVWKKVARQRGYNQPLELSDIVTDHKIEEQRLIL